MQNIALEQPEAHAAGLDNIATDNFLDRERAALGDDAAQFASANDNTATVEDEEEDLLGGDYSGGHTGGQDMSFESSFPAIDTSNDVWTVPWQHDKRGG